MPPQLAEEWKRIQNLPGRNAGKNQLKAEWREAFINNGGWSAPMFQKFFKVEKVREDSEIGQWVSWKELTDAYGTEVAEALLADNVVVSRPWVGTDPRRGLKQYRRVLESDAIVCRTTQGQEVSEAFQAAPEAVHTWQLNAESFASVGAQGTAYQTTAPQPKKKPKPDKDGPEDACNEAVRKALSALDAKVGTAKALQAQSTGVKYTSQITDDIARTPTYQLGVHVQRFVSNCSKKKVSQVCGCKYT